MTTRKDAILMGIPRYNTGKPCKAGHDSDRYTSTGGCMACLVAKQETIRKIAREARQHENAQRMNGAMPHQYFIPRQHDNIMKDLASILRTGSPELIDHVAKYLEILK